MNLHKNPTIKELKDLIRACDDSAGSHILWVNRLGDVHITLLKDETPASWATRMEKNILFRYESYSRGNDYVGENAANDHEYVSSIFRQLFDDWKAANSYSGDVNVQGISKMSAEFMKLDLDKRQIVRPYLDEIYNQFDKRNAKNEKVKNKKVFISYARDDFDIASEIYRFLKSNDFLPWMDKFNLVPGQNWELEISENIKTSDFFVACLSQHSVSKRGYVQNELGQALSVLKQFPEDGIYLIPIRLDDCIVPESLSKRQWLDWAETNAKHQLLRALSTH